MQFLNYVSFPSARILSLLAFLSLGMASSALADNPSNPASDFTITVQELESGDVEFSLSGTAYYKAQIGNPYRTPTDSDTPPHTLAENEYEEFTIPEGLVLTTPDNHNLSSLHAPTRETPLTYLSFSSGGYWSFYSFSTGQLNYGDEMVGSGSVVTDVVPFSHFEPGTFVVEGYEFDATYIVRAYTPPLIPTSPRLKALRTSVFSSTRLRKSSRTSRIVIRNIGDAPVEKLSLRVSGSGSRDFRITKRPASTIAPGKSTTLKAFFRPRAVGSRRAIVSLLSNAPTTKITLKGKGLRPQGTISPRFPGR